MLLLHDREVKGKRDERGEERRERDEELSLLRLLISPLAQRCMLPCLRIEQCIERVLDIRIKWWCVIAG